MTARPFPGTAPDARGSAKQGSPPHTDTSPSRGRGSIDHTAPWDALDEAAGPGPAELAIA